MLIVVAIVIALTRHSMKEGVYLIKRWPRWQTDADVQNCSIMMKMCVELIGMVLAVMVIKNKTNLASSWGRDGEEKARHPSPAIMILALISNGFLCCFCVFHSFRFSVFVETYLS